MIKANVPLAELDRYSTTLRSLTQGRGNYTERSVGYQAVPTDLQHKLVAGYSEAEAVA